MKINIILWLLFFSNLLLNANDKEFCYSLTNSNDTFLVKYVTIITENEQIIGYSNSNEYNISDKIEVGNNSLYLCEYQSIYNKIISYLVYIDKSILFINDKAVKYTDEQQGLSFQNIIYSNDKLTIYYETTGGTHYYNYKFIFDKIDNNFKLTKAIYHYRIVRNDDFDLEVIQLDNENTLLSNFKIDEYIEIFNDKYNKKYSNK